MCRRNGFQRRLAIGLVVWVVVIAGCTGKNGQPDHFEGEAQASSDSRMGTFLAEQHDDRYMTVSLQALRGENVYFDTPSTNLETFTITPEGLDALTRLVSETLPGSALFGTAAALGSASARSFLEAQGALPPRSPDVLTVVDSVRPATLIPEYDPR